MHRLLLREGRNNRSNSDFQTFFEEFSLPFYNGYFAKTSLHEQPLQLKIHSLLRMLQYLWHGRVQIQHTHTHTHHTHTHSCMCVEWGPFIFYRLSGAVCVGCLTLEN